MEICLISIIFLVQSEDFACKIMINKQDANSTTDSTACHDSLESVSHIQVLIKVVL